MKNISLLQTDTNVQLQNCQENIYYFERYITVKSSTNPFSIPFSVPFCSPVRLLIMPSWDWRHLSQAYLSLTHFFLIDSLCQIVQIIPLMNFIPEIPFGCDLLANRHRTIYFCQCLQKMKGTKVVRLHGRNSCNESKKKSLLVDLHVTNKHYIRKYFVSITHVLVKHTGIFVSCFVNFNKRLITINVFFSFNFFGL